MNQNNNKYETEIKTEIMTESVAGELNADGPGSSASALVLCGVGGTAGPHGLVLGGGSTKPRGGPVQLAALEGSGDSSATGGGTVLALLHDGRVIAAGPNVKVPQILVASATEADADSSSEVVAMS